LSSELEVLFESLQLVKYKTQSKAIQLTDTNFKVK
jgi:hypothetical protein